MLAESKILDTALQPSLITFTISQAQKLAHHGLPGRKTLSEGPVVVQLDLDVAVVGGDGEVVPGQADGSMVVERVLVSHQQEPVLEEDGEVASEEDQPRLGLPRSEAQPDLCSGPLREEGGGEGDVRLRAETDTVSSLSGQLTEVAVISRPTVTTEHSVVTLTLTSVRAGRGRTG